ncbi:hypothetical protein [Luteibacter sp. E-22]|uniref:hypothetical protein n=1 Tax=Luteibacter sp. E-22 TaxID=3404050 RepID=UPI003CF20890
MSAHAMATQALAGEIVEALLKDEKTDGFDLCAGMFGTEFSNLIRRLASDHLELSELRAEKARSATP